jgi:hypothetical protein
MKAEFGAKLDRALADIKELKDNVAARVTDLENEKLNKDDFGTYISEHSASHKILLDGQTDHEKRIRSLETAKNTLQGERKGISAFWQVVVTVVTVVVTWFAAKVFGR